MTGLRLSSDAPGALTIRWDTPSPAPSDYRIVWAPADQGFPSWSAPNETLRGNEYPDGSATSLTLTGLTKGIEFKARMRARYNTGEYADARWSGPWTATVTQRVRGDAPAAPTGLTVREQTDKKGTTVELSWTAPGHGALTGYRIWRGADAGAPAVLVEDTGDASTKYTDATAEADTSYTYAVAALSPDGDSPRSERASLDREGLTATEDRKAALGIGPRHVGDTTHTHNVAITNVGSYPGSSTFSFDSSSRPRYGTQFTTGSNAAGYIFQGGTFNLAVPSAAAVSVALYSDSSGSPGSSLRSTTGTPDNNRATADEFLASTPFTLAASTKYWLVAHATDDTPQPSIGTASSTAADSGALPGWSIGTSKFQSSGSWAATSENSAFAVGVFADVATGVTAVAVTSEPLSGDTYKEGENIEVEYTFSANVTYVGSVAAIRIGDDGDSNYRSAGYVGGSGTTKLLYRYKVKSTDTDATGISVDTNSLGRDPDSGKIVDGAGNAVTPTHAQVAQDAEHKVDGSTLGCNYVLCTDVTVANLTSADPPTVLGATYSATSPDGSLSNRSFHLGGHYVVVEILERDDTHVEILLDRPPGQKLLAAGTLHFTGADDELLYYHFHEGAVSGNRVTWDLHSTSSNFTVGAESRVTIEDDVLVSNLEQASSNVNFSGAITKFAQGVEIGRNPNGFLIDEIRLKASAAAGVTLSVSLQIGLDKDVVTLATLTAPPSLGTATDEDSFTLSEPLFVPLDSSFYIIVERSGSGDAGLLFTTSEAEDRGKAFGSKIDNDAHSFENGAWSTFSQGG